MLINTSHMVQATKLLGPYDRSVLWVQGCCFNCKGCLATEMQSDGGEWLNIDDVAKYLCEPSHIEGITISGGEPFLQSGAIVKLITILKEQRDLGVIIYSGFTLEELISKGIEDINIKKILNLTDILIDGRYDISLDIGQPLRGSSNQRIHLLTDRYKDVFEAYYVIGNRKTEIRIDEQKIAMIGVPSAESLSVWKKLKEKASGTYYGE